MTTRWEYIQKNGVVSEKETPDTVAKMSFNSTEQTARYYVMLSGGELMDPHNTSISYLRRRMWKFRLVQKIVYDLYLKYLGYPDRKSLGQKPFKLHAERMI